MIEILLFGLMPEVKPNSLIQTIQATHTVQVEPLLEPTLEEKIITNYYKCDESIEWIRADNAQCLSKLATHGPYNNQSGAGSSTPPVTLGNKATAPPGWFPAYQCTWHIWAKRPVGLWNDASDWLWQAQRDGWATGTTPIVGAIGWQSNHVVYIEAIDGVNVYISERNYDNRGSYREGWRLASQYIYIY